MAEQEPQQQPSSSKPGHLEPSKLGTKEYWDALYDTEIANHVSNPADIGTVWFDDSDAESKMVAFLDAHESSLSLDRSSASVLDLGTGNGSLLHALRRAGWAGPALGVDYSPAAVALARQVADAKLSLATSDSPSSSDDEDDEDAVPRPPPSRNPVNFAPWDVLAGPLGPATTPAEGAYDLVTDKGTFDAVCLSADVDAATGRRRCDGYRGRVIQLLRRGGGVFLITSCNWTERELRAWFEGEEDGAERLEYAGRAEYRSFSFGGIKGQTISTVCFVKREGGLVVE